MNQMHLARCLGVVSPHSFQRLENGRLVQAMEASPGIHFDSKSQRFDHDATRPDDTYTSNKGVFEANAAHQAGTNCLAIDNQEGRYLISGGADGCVHLWDLEARPSSLESFTYRPSASLTRSTPGSHTHALTSLCIYPFDPTLSTVITASHDKTVKLISVTSASLQPVHAFSLDYSPYTLSLSLVTSVTPLVAVGTAHPVIRLLDLRSGLGTHSLPGHNGAVYSIAWSPRSDYVLASGASDGRVLFFDIRRANAAFASLDLEDAIGVVGEAPSTGVGARKPLDWALRAHAGPVTGVQWVPGSEQLITTGHDQRIRVWDGATGRNELVHFGPRIRNDRLGELSPLVSPNGCGRSGKEVLFWPNDDGKGEIYVYSLREGNLIKVLRTPGIPRVGVHRSGIGRLTSGGRINRLVWRWNSNAGEGIELYSAHGDGRICGWASNPAEDREVEEQEDWNKPVGEAVTHEKQRKRKLDKLDSLIDGLTKKPMATHL